MAGQADVQVGELVRMGPAVRSFAPGPLQGLYGTESPMSRQEEKDAELDRRIVALRKKNQALLRRYQVSGL